MKIFTPCCNEFLFLLPGYFYTINKYWKGAEIIVLGYDVPNTVLPHNVKFVSLGKQTRDWSAPLIQYFEQSDEEVFVLNLEDMFLVDYVDTSKIDKIMKKFEKGEADKAMLHFYMPNTVIDLEDGFVEIKQTEPYRTSLHPAIWSRQYFLKHLRPNMSPWAFEIQHKRTKNDGAKIIYTKDSICPNAIFNTSNIHTRGKLNATALKLKTDKHRNGLVHKEDIVNLKKLIGLA